MLDMYFSPFPLEVLSINILVIILFHLRLANLSEFYKLYLYLQLTFDIFMAHRNLVVLISFLHYPNLQFIILPTFP
jgi:hypothetical protein